MTGLITFLIYAKIYKIAFMNFPVIDGQIQSLEY